MKKLIIIVLTLSLALSLAACGIKDKVQDAVKDAISGTDGGSVAVPSGGEIKTSSATDKWPAGVYNAVGVQEYKAGKVVYSYPDDEQGNVYIQTTRDEMLAYIEQIKNEGFRPEPTLEQNLSDHQTWSSFTMYFPETGGRYSLEIGYHFDNGGEGISEEFYLTEDAEEPTRVFFNLSIRLSDHGIPEGITKKDLLAGIGLPDSAVIPKNAVEVNTEMAIADPAFYIYEFDTPFDFEVTKEYFREYADALIDACAGVTQDGKLKGIGAEADAATAKAQEWSTWQYSYQGKEYMIMLSGETGFESGLTVAAQQVK